MTLGVNQPLFVSRKSIRLEDEVTTCTIVILHRTKLSKQLCNSYVYLCTALNLVYSKLLLYTEEDTINTCLYKIHYVSVVVVAFSETLLLHLFYQTCSLVLFNFFYSSSFPEIDIDYKNIPKLLLKKIFY